MLEIREEVKHEVYFAEKVLPSSSPAR